MKRTRGWLILGVVLALLFVFSRPLERAADALLSAPWAYGWDRRGDLTTDWTGALPDGRVLDVALERETDATGMPVPADGDDARLVGTGRLCGAGEAAVFALQGSGNRSGSRVGLLFFSGDTAVGELSGSWSGDVVALSGRLFDAAVALRLTRGSACS